MPALRTVPRAMALNLALAVVGVTPAAAQNTSSEALSGSTILSAGFSPDPYRVSVTAGGSIDAYEDTDLPAECVGSISDAPDYEVEYSAGSFPLVFRTTSSEDTTLIINGPDGTWRCDDDSYGDGDAEVRFNKPLSGTYDVWIGSYSGNFVSATLLITETP
jgi:hypothetical protein